MKEKTKKRVVGIDLGFAGLGIAIAKPSPKRREFHLCYCDSILRNKQPILAHYVSDRNVSVIRDTVKQFADLMEAWARRYELFFAVELPSGGSKNASAARAMALSTGWFAAASVLMNMRFTTLTPEQGKIALTGVENASKELMMAEVLKQHYYFSEFPKYKNRFEHAADAVGALTHAFNGDPFLLDFLRE